MKSILVNLFSKCFVVILFSLIIFSIKLSAQNIRTFNTVNSGGNYSACKEIQLLPGFEFNAQSNNSFGGTIKSEACEVIYSEGPVDPNDPNDPSNFSTQLEIGAISGTWSVGPTGAAMYSIPLDFPIGINGIQPNFSLSYNSQSGAGLLGYGMNLSGMSSISRSGSTYFFEKDVRGIELNTKDNFLLNGNLLIVTNNQTYGSANSKYITQNETFSTVEASGELLGTAPKYFIVKNKEGLLLEYGNTVNSRQLATSNNEIIQWMINKVTDPFGNYMIYDYESIDGNIFIKSIKYTGNARKPIEPFCTIKFNYQKRLDKTDNYLKGEKIGNNLLLTQITIERNGVELKSYSFDYLYNFYSFLKSIQLTINKKELNKLVFKWSNKNFTDYQLSNVTGNSGLFSFDQKEITENENTVVLDNQKIDIFNYNGDARSDIYITDRKTKKVSVYSFDENVNRFKLETDFQFNAPENGYDFSFSTEPISLPIDFTGDGLDDIIIPYVWTPNNSSPQFSSMAYSNSGGTHFESLSNYYSRILIGDKFSNMQYGDFNGDGTMDLFQFSNCWNNQDGFSPGAISCFTSNKDLECNYFDSDIYNQSCESYYSEHLKLFSMGVKQEPTCDDWSDRVYPINWNGNSKTDLLVLKPNASFIMESQFNGESNGSSFNKIFVADFPRSNDENFFGDFNGDGKTDVLTWNSITLWNIYFSTGSQDNSNGFVNGNLENLNLLEAHKPNSDGFRTIVLDFNGDGKSDILQMSPYNIGNSKVFKLICYYSNGQTIIQKSIIDFPIWNSRDVPTDLHFGDFNGDGLLDIFIKGLATNDEYFIFSKKQDNNLMAIEEVINNGNNTKVQYQYSNLSNSSVYIGGNPVLPENCIVLKSPIKVVNEVKIFDNNDPLPLKIGYVYESLVYHKTGMGILGFSKLKITDSDKNIQTTTFNKWNSKKMFLEFSSSTQLYVPTQLALSLSENTFKNFYSETTKQTLIFDEIVKNENFLNNEGSWFSKKIDNNGNVIEINSEYYFSKSLAKSSKQLIENYTNVNSEIANRPQKITTQYSKPGEPTITTVQGFVFEGINSNTTKNLMGTDKETQTQVQFDEFGNVKERSLSAAGLETKTEKFEFDALGQNILKKTNPLNYSSNYVYGGIFSNLIEEKNINKEVVKSKYDDLGRVVETEDPLGKKITLTYSWDNSIGIIGSTKILKTFPNGETEEIIYDNLSRERVVKSFNLNQQEIKTITYYNHLSQLAKTQEFINSQIISTQNFEYDFLGRKTKVENLLSNKTFITTFEYPVSKNKIITAMSNGQITSSETLVNGDKIITDGGGTTTYTMNATGQPILITPPDGKSITMEYDVAGNQTLLNDPNAGKIVYAYNAFGQLIFQDGANTNDAISITKIDKLGRVLEETSSSEIKTYTYDLDPLNIGSLSKMMSSKGQEMSYFYNERGQRIKETLVAFNKEFSNAMTYDAKGRLSSRNYPSGFKVLYYYDGKDNLVEIKDSNAKSLWKRITVDRENRIIDYTIGENRMACKNTFDDFGNLTEKQIGSLLNYRYEYNPNTSNLTSREDLRNNIKEIFSYDNLDRLINFSNFRIGKDQVPMQNQTIQYGANGNIYNKSDAGYYNYTSSHPHAVTWIDDNSGSIPPITQLISYNYKNDVEKIEEGEQSIEFFFGPESTRIRTELFKTTQGVKSMQWRKYAFRDYERYENSLGQTEKELTYIQSPSGLIGIYLVDVQNPQGKFLLVGTDHIGSIITLADVRGTQIEERNFDAWGRARNPKTLEYLKAENINWITNRGFTGHEHLFEFGLIHMNGRVYDPVLGRMLSPDNYVQDATYSQSFNRYSYCWNNPLKYTDPSGELVWFVPVIYAAVNVGVDLYMSNGNMTWGQIGKSAALGAVGGLLGGAGITTVGGAFLSAGLSQVNRLLPSINIYQSPELNVSISPMIGFGTSGFNFGGSLNASGQTGDFAYSASVGAGYNSGVSSLGDQVGGSAFWNAGGFAGYNDGHANYGYGYSYNSFGGRTSQGVGEHTLQIGDFSARWNNDIFGDGKDRYRTNGVLATYKVNDNLTIAAGVSMMTGMGRGDIDIPGGNPNIKNGFYDNCKEDLYNLRGGSAYGGAIYKGQAYFAGQNSEKRLHKIQDFIHRNPPINTSPYFEDRMMKSRGYSYYGGYHRNYLFY